MMKHLKGVDYVLPPFVVIDFETTGFSNKEDEIIEYGAIKVDEDWKTTATFSQLAYPMYKIIPPNVSKLTGIDSNLLRQEQADLTFFVMEDFLSFVGGYPVVGHNVKFDIGFIENALWVRRPDEPAVFTNPMVDTLHMAKKILPGLPSYNLANLCYRIGIRGKKFHRALYDVENTFELYCYLLEKIGVKIK